MKSSTRSNLRPLLCAFYPFLIAIAMLWAIPRDAGAQILYVTSRPGSGAVVVSKYNAITGALINANFITGLSSENDEGLALLGNTLFVADCGRDTVGAYDATTGAPIKADFITGVPCPQGLAVKRPSKIRGGPGPVLFVVNFRINRVGAYDGSTGAPIDPSLIREGLDRPVGLAFSSGILYVANKRGTVGKYRASDGFALNANFITGLDEAEGLALLGRTLFVTDYGSNRVGAYDIKTGATIKANFIKGLLAGPEGIAVGRLLVDTLFVANSSSGTVGAYDATTGATIKRDFITGLILPYGLAFKSAE